MNKQLGNIFNQTPLIMKNKLIALVIILIVLSVNCKAQSNFDLESLLKIEDYTYGSLEMKVIPFGLGKEIYIGKILEDGTIHFEWPKIESASIESSSIFMEPIKTVLLGMNYCEEDQIKDNSENCSVVNTQYIYLYKDKKQVGVLFPSTDHAILDNEPANIYSNLTSGSSLSWFYSDGDCVFIAKCVEKLEWEGKYNFERENTYDIHLKKGWNIVQYTLSEIEEFKDENGAGKMEKKVQMKTLDRIPGNIKWHIKTFVKMN